jgi:7-carboxy-7-deazaguanine synthase
VKINEIFRSIQGEGQFIGTPTVFVRTTGCNLRCSWCDTTYAFSKGKEMKLEEILAEVEQFNTPHVCVTGGEPMMQGSETIKLLDSLLQLEHHVTLETNGSYSLEDLPCSEWMMVSMDWKCPSSGMNDKMLLENLELLSPLDQLKFIVADKEDMLFAYGFLKEHPVQCTAILTPVGGVNLKDVAEFVLKKKMNARALPQLHKLIWGDKRGV